MGDSPTMATGGDIDVSAHEVVTAAFIDGTFVFGKSWKPTISAAVGCCCCCCSGASGGGVRGVGEIADVVGIISTGLDIFSVCCR